MAPLPRTIRREGEAAAAAARAAALAAQAGARPAVAAAGRRRAPYGGRARRCRATIGKERPRRRRARPLSQEPRSTPCRSRRRTGSTPSRQAGRVNANIHLSLTTEFATLVGETHPHSPVRRGGGMGQRSTSRCSLNFASSWAWRKATRTTTTAPSSRPCPFRRGASRSTRRNGRVPPGARCHSECGRRSKCRLGGHRGRRDVVRQLAFTTSGAGAGGRDGRHVIEDGFGLARRDAAAARADAAAARRHARRRAGAARADALAARRSARDAAEAFDAVAEAAAWPPLEMLQERDQIKRQQKRPTRQLERSYAALGTARSSWTRWTRWRRSMTCHPHRQKSSRH